jgi:hypothetical protein
VLRGLVDGEGKVEVVIPGRLTHHCLLDSAANAKYFGE